MDYNLNSDIEKYLDNIYRVVTVHVASAQSDQSLPSPHEEALDSRLPFECTTKTRMPSLIRVFAGRTGHFDWFEVCWPSQNYCSQIEPSPNDKENERLFLSKYWCRSIRI